jgi:hypothetical protein
MAYFKVLSEHLPEGNKEKYKKPMGSYSPAKYHYICAET